MLRQIIGIAVSTNSVINKFDNTQTTVHIEFLPGKDWLPLNITSGTFEFSEKVKTSDAGVMYEQKLKAGIPYAKVDPDIIRRLQYLHLFIRIAYNNDDVEVIGCPDFPAQLTTDLSIIQSSYYKLEFTCNTIYKSFRLIN